MDQQHGIDHAHDWKPDELPYYPRDMRIAVSYTVATAHPGGMGVEPWVEEPPADWGHVHDVQGPHELWHDHGGLGPHHHHIRIIDDVAFILYWGPMIHPDSERSRRVRPGADPQWVAEVASIVHGLELHEGLTYSGPWSPLGAGP